MHTHSGPASNLRSCRSSMLRPLWKHFIFVADGQPKSCKCCALTWKTWEGVPSGQRGPALPSHSHYFSSSSADSLTHGELCMPLCSCLRGREDSLGVRALALPVTHPGSSLSTTGPKQHLNYCQSLTVSTQPSRLRTSGHGSGVL